MSPHVTGLSKRTRASVFAVLVCIFMLGTPLLWLYASGYRLTQNESGVATSSRTFTPTGGLYIGVEGDATVSVDGTPMRGSRFFRNAIYLDGVVAGTHRIVVERPGFHTWVKELSVTSQLVTEAYTFAMPATTTLRIITPRMTADGDMARTASSTIDADIDNAYSVVARNSAASRALVANPRFETLKTLFIPATTTATSTYGSLATMRDEIRALGTLSATSATTVLATKNDTELVRIGDDIFARYIGSVGKMPYYFCALRSGGVATSTDEQGSTDTAFAASAKGVRNLTGCDPSITIDRQGQVVTDVQWYPGSVDAVLVTRSDGIFVTEVDPRGGWQNTQSLVRGTGLHVQTSGNTMYIYDGIDIYEVVR